MDSVYPETRNMVRVLTQKLIEAKDKSFTGQGQSGRIVSNRMFPFPDSMQIAV
jgi:hypothetical protein